MTWNVFRYNINKGVIETYNIFNHGGFLKDVQEQKEECGTIEELAEELKKSLMYYFWCKSEWEVLISPWPSDNSDQSVKVDIYTQVMQNWPVFLDYVWGY